MFSPFQFLLLVLFAFTTLISCVPSPSRHGPTQILGLGVPISNSDAKSIIPNRYIVVYHNDATDKEVKTHQASVMSSLRRRSLERRTLDGRVLSNEMNTFSMMGWRGMALEADDGMILEIASERMVSSPLRVFERTKDEERQRGVKIGEI